MRYLLLVLAVALAFPPEALAHPGHAGPSFGGGLAHPLSGVDHLLAMLAVGLWAGQIGGRARWILPGAFVLVMAGGGWLGMTGVPLPGVEAGIAASVLLLGLLVATAAKWPLIAATPLVAAFALLHGHAHGTEFPAAASAVGYVGGFVAATAALHAVGLAISALASGQGRAVWLRLGGAGIALAGLVIALA